ncbi:MAG: helix-turn-helix domain-containing protein [Anaerolineae bacterium]
MTESEQKLKRKIRGVLMRNARNRAGLNLNETAAMLGLAPQTLADYEFGRREAGLPILEALARITHVPVNHFWSDGGLPAPNREFANAKAIALRQKMMGVLLNKARAQAGYTQEKVAQYLGLTADQITAYELGQAEIPFSQLEALASFFDVGMGYFLDGADIAVQQPNGRAEAQAVSLEVAAGATPEALEQYPEEIRAFVLDSSNVLYIKLAMRLHGLSTETLRALAEGILDITY